MSDYKNDAKNLRAAAADLDDTNPMKLSLLTLACVAECYAAAATFEERAATNAPEFHAGATQAAKAAAERLLISVAAPIRAIVAERNLQNDTLAQIIESLVRRPGTN